MVSGSRDGNYLSQDLTLHTGTFAMAEPLQSAEAGDTARQHGVGGQGITDDLNGATRLNGWNVLNGLIPMRSGVNETWLSITGYSGFSVKKDSPQRPSAAKPQPKIRNISRKACPEPSRRDAKAAKKIVIRTWRSSRLGGRNLRV